MSTPKSCPFGKCRSRKTSTYESSTQENGNGWQVFCNRCGAAGPHMRTEDEAVAAWNSAWRGKP